VRNLGLRRAVAASVTVCPECGEAPTEENPLTADHIVAQIDGGQDVPENLRPRCRSCNSRRGAERGNGVGGRLVHAIRKKRGRVPRHRCPHLYA
jgi:5-methylcytosine-specific restriction endonuclease McrA